MPTYRPLSLLIVALFAVLLAAAIAMPYVTASDTLGDDLTRYTVRVALVFYAASALIRLLLRPVDWQSDAAAVKTARLCWTLGLAAFLVHLYMAFHHYHNWSHAHAVEHTRQVSGVGEGIYFSHLFTLLWTADVLYWWLRPNGYATRRAGFDYALQGFMAFMTFNGTIVYERGFIRWAGVAMFTLFAAAMLVRLRQRSRGGRLATA